MLSGVPEPGIEPKHTLKRDQVWFVSEVQSALIDWYNKTTHGPCLTVLQNKSSRMHHKSHFDYSRLKSFYFPTKLEHRSILTVGFLQKCINCINRITQGFMVLFKYWITERRITIRLIIFLPSFLDTLFLLLNPAHLIMPTC